MGRDLFLLGLLLLLLPPALLGWLLLPLLHEIKPFFHGWDLVEILEQKKKDEQIKMLAKLIGIK